VIAAGGARRSNSPFRDWATVGTPLKIGRLSRAFVDIVAAPARDVALRWPREHCRALRDTAQRDCARPAPPSARHLPGAGGRRPTPSERGFAGRAARTSPGGVCGLIAVHHTSSEEHAFRSRRFDCRRVAAGHLEPRRRGVLARCEGGGGACAYSRVDARPWRSGLTTWVVMRLNSLVRLSFFVGRSFDFSGQVSGVRWRCR
jgi:hypothetical protein